MSFDKRLQQLVNLGYSESIATDIGSKLPSELLTKIGDAKTPNEAKKLLTEGLADQKATIDETES